MTQVHTISDFFVEIFEHEHILMLSKEKGSFRNLEIKLRKKSGDTATVLASGEIISYKGRTGLLCMFNDITERKRLEREILEISRREQRRIGRDLHDGLVSHLSGVLMLSKGIANDLRSGRTLKGGLGRHIMEYRAHMIGASLERNRGLNGGTLVTCSMPLEKKPVG